MKSKILMLLVFCLVGIGTVFGQTISVNGTVLDEKNEPVIMATVRLKKDASVGTATNMQGKFTLKANKGDILVISFVGYKTQELPAQEQMRIKLEPDSEMLDEVIVVAYGTARKSTFTGAAAVVDSKQLEKVQAPDAVKALEGAVPGLTLSSESGAPGTKTEIRVRGVGSMNAGKAPLIILNGAPYEGNINSINPRDIESISLLKDAASAALYGARGANGVLLITTKSGRSGVTSVTFDARVGVNQRGVPEYDMIRDPGQFYELYWDGIRNNKFFAKENPLGAKEAAEFATKNLIMGQGLGLGYNIYNVPNDQVVDVNGRLNPKAAILYEDAATFNDWSSLLMKPGMRQEYNLSLTRGVEKNNVFFSLGYLSDEGYAINTAFQRISSRLAYDTQVYDWLKFSASSQVSYTSGNFGRSASSAFSNVFFFTRDIAPIYPVYLHDKSGKIILDKNGEKEFDTGLRRDGINNARLFSSGKNIVGESNLNRDQYARLYLTQNGRVDLDLTHGFKLNSTATVSYINGLREYFVNPIMGDGSSYGGLLQKTQGVTKTFNWNQILTWDGKVNDFTLSALLGHEAYSYEYSHLYAEKKNTFVPSSLDFNTFAQPTDINSYKDRYRIEGYFGQITADYLEKYYLSASLRRDGSSIFAPEHRWGTFWSLGASWQMHKEDFLREVSWLDQLKLRASYGVQGNDNLLDDGERTGVYERVYTPYTNWYAITSDGNSNSVVRAYMGNREITWEKNGNLSLGLEFALFKNRLTGEFDFFTRKTTDMLFNEPVSKTTGFTYQPQNLGAMRNDGFEFNITGRIISNEKVQWTVGVNGMTYKNTVLKLPERFKEEGLVDGNLRIIKEGGGIYDLYMVKWGGVNPENGNTQFYIYDDEKNKPKAGETEFTGTPEYKLVQSEGYRSEVRDRQYLGSAIPKLDGGFYTTLSAYGFDFNAQFAYRIGGLVYDNNYANTMTPSPGEGRNSHKDMLNRWTPTNKNSDIPRIELQSQSLSRTSSRFLTDASFLSLRNITLGYTLPVSWTEKIGSKGLRLYVAADNVFLLSARRGFDPRTTFSGGSSSAKAGVIRTISAGLTVNL